MGVHFACDGRRRTPPFLSSYKSRTVVWWFAAVFFFFLFKVLTRFDRPPSRTLKTHKKMQPRMRDRKPTTTEAAAAARSQIPPRPSRRRAAAAASAASKNGIFSSLNVGGGGGGVWVSGNSCKIVAGCVFVAGLLLLLWSWNWSTDKAHGVLTPLHAKPISQLTQVCMPADFFAAILYADGLQMLWRSDRFALLFAAFFWCRRCSSEGERDRWK